MKTIHFDPKFTGIRRGKGVDEEKLAEEIAKMQRNGGEGNKDEYL